MSFKLKFTLLVGSLVLSLLVLAIIGSFNVMSTAGKADVLSELVNDDVNQQIEGMDTAIVLVLEADRDLHQAVIAEKLALSATDDIMQQVDNDNSENAQQAYDRIKQASVEFDTDELKGLYAQFLEKYDVWLSKTRNVLKNVQDQSKYQFARRISEGSAKQTFDDMRDIVDQIGAKMQEHRVELTTRAHTNEEQVRGIAGDLIESSGSMATIVVVVELILGIGAAIFAFIFGKKSFRTFAEVINELNTQSQKVSYISVQFKSGSEQISSGASAQASSLEEISSSLEEMASMAQESTHNVNEARKFASEAHSAAEDGQDAMRKMIEAIDSIKTSADETAKIIKTIDEIAFQTNLLALNAAVEAARAGEAGKGFAVVAEEVRNLAQRSAEAARVTTELIEGSKQNTDNGVSVSRNVEERLVEIVTSVSKANGLIAEVATASEEQTTGIQQINDAVANLDKVTQQNAAGAEESSSASAELSSQAEHMEEIVDNLATIISGSGGSGHDNEIHSAKSPRAVQSAEHTHLPSKTTSPKPVEHKPVSKKSSSHAIAPETVIPLDDDELHDF